MTPVTRSMLEVSQQLGDFLREYTAEQNGSARQQLWPCEDGWIVGYTTERVSGGPHHGKFVALAYAPTSQQTLDEGSLTRTYWRSFTKRRLAKARAVELFKQHSPKWAERQAKREQHA